MKVSELIEQLQRMPQDVEVIIPIEGARSKTPSPIAGKGFNPGWGYTLESRYFGFSEAEKEGKTFPVVWL